MERAESLLGPLLKRLGIAEDVRLRQIRNDWQTLFGKPLSTHMSPSRFFEGDLLLCVDSPAWMQQLVFCKGEILKKLAGYGVRDLRFRIGRVTSRNPRADCSVAKTELSSEEALFISEVVSRVGDEELRETIRKTIEKSLLFAGPGNNPRTERAR